MPTFHTVNFGCRANQADGAAVEQELAQRGFAAAGDAARADVVIVNSCTVTASADQQARQIVRRIHRENPAARILVTGCYAQRRPQELADLDGVRWVVGNSHKTEIASVLSEQCGSSARPQDFVPLKTLRDPLIRAATPSEPRPLASGHPQAHPNGDLPALEHFPRYCSSPGQAPQGRKIIAHGASRGKPARFELSPAGATEPIVYRNERNALGLSSPASIPASAEFAPQILVGDIFAQQEFSGAPVVGAAGDRTRPNLKVQDGCNNRCSFCIIPYVRGSSRSLPLSDVIRHIRNLCEAGYREVVLSGVNLGRYGRDLPDLKAKLRFPQLVRAILDDTPLERLRLSSVEPVDFSDPLLDLMASSERIAKHVHAPLQSGSNRVLARMRRKYRAEQYRERMLAAFQRMPNAAFGADVMVGFPGETEQDFDETRRFIESLPFTYLHVFPYSRRPSTPADKMKVQVHGAVVRERGSILRQLSAENNRRFRQRQVGRVLTVLTLEEAVEGGSSALSDNYLKVFIPGQRLPSNQLVPVRIVSLAGPCLVGERASAF
ncbi:MAG: tRNA (N(6)-L-threonylcarbamoyladenosine(37)-C(2))-methylthiotransferase MtaB [Acidobacteria bacterium]|nr:tRNA (N(6)-L-threonylcarbamoyladenosine(37)-C(2))-methylthiotransferase MtaB [Acidobacteriota bacterium]